MDSELIGRLIDQLSEAKASRAIAEQALAVATQALAEVRGLKSSTHKIQYVNTEAIGQINQEMAQYMPDTLNEGVEANFELGKRLAEMGETLEEVDDEIDE